jgi:hypothetical protein
MKKAVAGLTLAAWITVCLANPICRGDDSKGTYDLHSGRKAGQLNRVELTIEVGGELKVNRGEKITPVKMNVAGQLAYDEKLVEFPSGRRDLLRSVRYYDKATATLKLDRTTIKPELRSDRRLIAVEAQGAASELFSPQGTLRREEVDLIDIMGNSLVVDRLLPDKAVAVGEIWKHTDECIAPLLGLDKVTRLDLRSTLVSVSDGLARMQVAGRVEGSFGGADTEIDVKGKYQYSLDSRQVTWVGLLIKENRKVGEVTAGIDAVALLQMTIASLDRSAHLSDSALAGLKLDATPRVTQLCHHSADGIWSITHDRKWYLNADEREMTVLRLVEDGQRVAQCNISTLPNAVAGKPPTLTQFQADVRQALEKNFEKFFDATELKSVPGYRVYRVAAAGVVSDLPIRWYYYLVLDDRGHQAVFAFTIVEELNGRLEGADVELVKSLRFNDAKATAKK